MSNEFSSFHAARRTAVSEVSETDWITDKVKWSILKIDSYNKIKYDIIPDSFSSTSSSPTSSSCFLHLRQEKNFFHTVLKLLLPLLFVRTYIILYYTGTEFVIYYRFMFRGFTVHNLFDAFILYTNIQTCNDLILEFVQRIQHNMINNI